MRSSLVCFGCKYLEHYYYSTGNMDYIFKSYIFVDGTPFGIKE